MRFITIAASIVIVPAQLVGSASADFIRGAGRGQPLRVDTLTISTPARLREIETNKAQPSRLAWSPDGSQLYVQTLEGNFADLAKGLTVKLRHYVVSAADGASHEPQVEPDWAREYWTGKSEQTSPDGPPWKVELKSEERIENTTSVPRGGDLAKGGTTVGTGAGTDDAAAAIFNRQVVRTHRMLLRGEVVGKFENTVIVPGLTFGWGPPGTRAIAFVAQRGGRVVLMDQRGKKKEIKGTKDAVLPAWSPDAKRVAWLQKHGNGKFLLQVSTVSGS